MKEEHFHLMKELKSWDFDVVLVDVTYGDKVLVNYLDKPSMMQAFYLPSSVRSNFFGSPHVYNTMYPALSGVKLNHDDGLLNHALMKMAEKSIWLLGFYVLNPQAFPYSNYAEELKAMNLDGMESLKGYLFGFGIDGFLDRV